ncbi:MAG: ComF family protein [Patescibacteria group bacterium]|nr:hypothetical protein [Patescibacteria group bacterium]MDE1966604.1 ComF family protein [Patescibacteria group bacterium]
MTPIRALFSVLLDSLFPVPAAEAAVLALSQQEALKSLPRAKQFPTAEACSVFAYKDERVRRLVWALKYKKSMKAARISGFAIWRQLALFSMAAPADRPIFVIPMPVTDKRRRERGYNQCELLADAVERFEAERISASDMISADPRIMIVRDLLIRARHKSRQTLKGREERLESAKGIFAVNEKAAEQAMKEGLVIVIDDVVTTGSTMRDAVETMRRAGYINTFGLSIAH